MNTLDNKKFCVAILTLSDQGAAGKREDKRRACHYGTFRSVAL